MAFTTGFWVANLEGSVARMNACLLGWGPKADFPAAASYKGMLALATDEGNVMYYSDGAAWVSLSIHPMKLKPAVTRWVIPGWYVNAASTQAFAADTITYIPIFVSETTTYIRIGIEVTTLSAGTADLRIFAWNNGVPGALILSAGTVDTGTTGLKELTISQQLTRGYYFLAIRCTGTPTLQVPDITRAIMPPVPGFGATGTPPIPYVGLGVVAAYADPAPAPNSVRDARWAAVILREN